MARVMCLVVLMSVGVAFLDEAATANSCTPAVVIDGIRLQQAGLVKGRKAVPGRRRVVARYGICEARQPILVSTYDGVPADVAVAWRGRVWLQGLSFTRPGDHPLHRLADRRTRRCTASRTTVEGVIGSELAGPDRLLVRRRDGGRTDVTIRSSTRLVRHPAWQPIRPGQRVRIRTERCGPRSLVARAIELVGPIPPAIRLPDRTDNATTPTITYLAAAGAAGLALLAGVIVARRRRTNT